MKQRYYYGSEGLIPYEKQDSCFLHGHTVVFVRLEVWFLTDQIQFQKPYSESTVGKRVWNIMKQCLIEGQESFCCSFGALALCSINNNNGQCPHLPQLSLNPLIWDFCLHLMWVRERSWFGLKWSLEIWCKLLTNLAGVYANLCLHLGITHKTILWSIDQVQTVFGGRWKDPARAWWSNKHCVVLKLSLKLNWGGIKYHPELQQIENQKRTVSSESRSCHTMQ